MYISQKRPYLYSIQKKKKEKGRKRVKKVPSSEKTFGNYVSDKRVIPKIQYTKNSYHLIAKKKNLIKKWAESLSRHFFPKKANTGPIGK